MISISFTVLCSGHILCVLLQLTRLDFCGSVRCLLSVSRCFLCDLNFQSFLVKGSISLSTKAILFVAISDFIGVQCVVSVLSLSELGYRVIP